MMFWRSEKKTKAASEPVLPTTIDRDDLGLLSIDHRFYTSRYSDLSSFSESDAKSHYAGYGYAEGRVSHPLAERQGLLAEVRKLQSVLELGPFCNPSVTGPNVQYFDVLDREHLLARARAHQQPSERVPDKIHFVSPTGDMSIIDKKFDAVVSSHCIEHQPDLIAHLQQVGRVLNPTGKYWLIVPDKRYCFDSLIAPSTLAGVLQAHHERRSRHTLASVIEHRALTTHNNAVAHWAGDHGQPHVDDVVARTKAAIAEFEAAKGGYVDVHAWQFTPVTLALIAQSLFKLGLSPFSSVQVFGTPHGQLEFCAILGR